MDPILQISKDIINYLGIKNNIQAYNLIKKHTNNLLQTGDFSFTLDQKIWQRYDLSNNKCDINILNLLNSISENAENIKEKLAELTNLSKSWKYPLWKCELWLDKCSIFLDRRSIFMSVLRLVSWDGDYGKFLEKSKNHINIERLEKSSHCSVSIYRAEMVTLVLENIIRFAYSSNHPEIEPEIIFKLNVNSNAACDKGINKNDNNENIKFVEVRCGIVLDSRSNKISNMTNEEYIKLRSTDMRLMAMHKYGIRVQNEKVFHDLIEQLGNAAVIIDLLEVKHTSPVMLKHNGQGCSKGASFILYNSARIETLLATFEKRIEEGIYHNLPPLEKIDVDLLTEEEEWELFFNYVMGFPTLIRRVLEGIEDGRCNPHLIPQFLNGLVSLFSVYYRRVRILTESRSHLTSTVYARIYLLKSLQKILNCTLSFFNIKPVQHM